MSIGINIEPNLNRYKFLFHDDCSSSDSINDSNDQHFIFPIDDKIINNIYQDPKNISINNKKYFSIKKVKKVGRKRKRDNSKVGKHHSKYDFDNIIRKVQVHFHNFIICFVNEILLNFGIKQKFLKIDYKEKKNVSKANVNSLKSKEIGKILCQNLSSKYRKQYKIDKEKNIKLYSEVIENDTIKKILSEPYINIFRNYYYVNKRDIKDYNLDVKLSSKVQTYKDFLKDFSKENEYIETIEKIVKKCYLPKKIFTKK